MTIPNGSRPAMSCPRRGPGAGGGRGTPAVRPPRAFRAGRRPEGPRRHPRPGPRARTTALVPVLLLGLTAALAGCSGDATSPVRRERPEIGWISPAPGDTLRGTAQLLAWVDLGEPVAAVACFVDGGELAVRTSVPWGFTLSPPSLGTGPELRPLVLEVEARGATTVARSHPVTVFYRRDDPPDLRVELPGRTDWVEIAPGRLLTAVITDREDGSPDAGTVEWRTEAGRRFRGGAFPSELLAEGDQVLRLWATDSAANRTERALRVRGFRYSGGEEPEEIARNLQAALSALDLERLEALLAAQFRVEACQPLASAGPDALSRAEFLAALRAVSADPGLERFTWGGTVALQGDETAGWALARWRQLGLLASRGGIEWRMVRMEAEIVLRRAEDGRWQALVLRERDRGDGPGLLTVLRSGVPFPTPA